MEICGFLVEYLRAACRKFAAQNRHPWKMWEKVKPGGKNAKYSFLVWFYIDFHFGFKFSMGKLAAPNSPQIARKNPANFPQAFRKFPARHSQAPENSCKRFARAGETLQGFCWTTLAPETFSKHKGIPARFWGDPHKISKNLASLDQGV